MELDSQEKFSIETLPVLNNDSIVSTNNTPEISNSISVHSRTNRGLIHQVTFDETFGHEEILEDGRIGPNIVHNAAHRRRVRRYKSEKWYRTNLELAIPFLFAGLGMVTTGYLLDQYITCLRSFQDLRELKVLVTPLLGLKGNLELTLAARLCTLVNLGRINTCTKKVNSSLADLALSQVQAIVVGFLASVFALLLLALEDTENYQFKIENVSVICASSILTASLASLFLGIFVVIIVFGSQKCNINPDNITTPIAAACGDIATLNILAWSSFFLYTHQENLPWLAAIIVLTYILLLPAIGYYVYKNEHTRKTMFDCWVPLITALVISSIAGLLFQYEDARFYNLSLYQPVINGVGGNLVSIQYNKLSTAYNRDGDLGKVPESSPGGPTNIVLTPYDTFFRLGKHSGTAWILICITIPGHCIFTGITVLIAHEHKHICFQYFIILYLIICTFQVGVLICLAHILTNYLWKKKVDPDSYVIPLITAIGDIVGTILLVIVFEIVYNGYCSSGRDYRDEDTRHAVLGGYNSTLECISS